MSDVSPESEPRLHKGGDLPADGVFLADSEGRVVWANQGISRITGYATHELLELTLPKLVPADELAITPPRLAELRQRGTLVTERRVRRKDGALIRVEITWRVLPDGHVLGTARHVQDRAPASPGTTSPTALDVPAADQPVAHPGGRLVLTTLGRAALDSISPRGERIEVLGPCKPLGLLVYLSCSPGRTATREHLIDLLWADQDLEAARHSVRQAVWFLRQRVAQAVVTAQEGNLTLAPHVESDREAFLDAVQRVDLERAVELYGGEFLPSFATPGGADFEQWADAERFRMHRLFTRLTETLVHEWLAKGRLRKAKQLATRVRDADPVDECGWRLVLESHLAANDQAGAEVAARQLERLLMKAERSAEPATRALLDLARSTPPDVSATTQAARVLVAELTAREREFSTILRAWDHTRGGAGGQSVHITGPAGLGKTRLLADVHTRLRSAGARAVLVRANPGERAVPWALASELAAALARLPGSAAISPASAGALVALNPALSSCYRAPPPLDHPPKLELLRRFEVALAELVHCVADEQPLAILIDDVHWADDDSRPVLSHVLTQALAHPVLVVTTARPGPGAALGRDSGETLPLAPLSTADIAALVASLGRLPTEPWAQVLPAQLNIASRGVPLLIIETLQLLIERGALSLDEGSWSCADEARLRVELAAGGALARRIQESERGAQWLLVLMAVAGTPLSAELLVRAADRDRDAVSADLQALELRGLATRDGAEWQPAHDEIAARAMELASPDALRAANVVVGRQLVAGGRDDPGVLQRAGRHLAAAGEDDELARVLRRRLTLQRRRGERRAPRALAAELLGEGSTPARVSHLVRSLPLHVRLGLVTPPRVAAVSLTVVGIGIGAAAAIFRAPPPAPDAWLVLIQELPGDSLAGVELPLRREGWDDFTPLNVARLGRPLPALAVRSDRYDVTASPDGKTWVYGRTVPDSGDIDLFAVGDDHVERRLTATPGDDDHASWSPDGRSLAFSTTRWSASRYYDLALFDFATGRIRRLTFDNSSASPSWSPDGTRIAFSYEDRRSSPDEPGHSLYCWITLDGSRRGCVDRSFTVLGWYDAEQMLVSINTPDHPLGRLNLGTGELHVLGARLNGPAEASPDGRWIVCYCVRPGTADQQWYVFPTDRPDLWRRLIETAQPASLLVRFVPNVERSSYVDHVEIIGPTDTVPLHTRYRLQARAFDPRAAVVPLSFARWRSHDTTVARIDDTSGVLTPVRPGSVTIQLSDGGWRTAFQSVTVAGAAPHVVLSEDWLRPLEASWVPYGDPKPVIDTGPGNRAAFWNHGDGWYESGAWSRATFNARRGLGVEAWWSTPVVGPRQQNVTMTLIANVDSLALARWDRRTGSAPFRGPGCSFSFPQGDGRPKRPYVELGSGPVPLPQWVLDGRWYRVRVQVFPDGRCGYALDGRLLAVSELPLVPIDPPYRVVLHGNSLGNRMLVGSLEVWSGVRDDVDWTAPEEGAPPASRAAAAAPTDSLPTVLRLRTVRPPPWH